MIADTLRWAFVLGAAPLLTGGALAVMQEARKFREPEHAIIPIALSYLVFVWAWAGEAYTNLGEPGTWRMPVAFAAVALGIGAEIGLWRHYRPARREERHSRRAEESPLVKEAERIRRQSDESR